MRARQLPNYTEYGVQNRQFEQVNKNTRITSIAMLHVQG